MSKYHDYCNRKPQEIIKILCQEFDITKNDIIFKKAITERLKNGCFQKENTVVKSVILQSR